MSDIGYNSQLQSPRPVSATSLPSACALTLATDEMFIIRPGSSAVASFASRSDNLYEAGLREVIKNIDRKCIPNGHCKVREVRRTESKEEQSLL